VCATMNFLGDMKKVFLEIWQALKDQAEFRLVCIVFMFNVLSFIIFVGWIV